MPALTLQQERILRQRLHQLYPASAKEDNSVKAWWAPRADRIRNAMLVVDRDQARALAMSYTTPLG